MKQILFVDDDPNILAGAERQFRKEYSVKTAGNASEGLTALGNGQSYAVVVADMNMPGMSGIEFLRRAKEVSPDVVRLMLTGNADQQTAMDAVNEGSIFRFLTKPCPSDVMLLALQGAVRQHELIVAEKELLEKTLNGSIKVLTEIISMVGSPSAVHSHSLRDKSLLLQRKISPLKPVWELEIAAMVSQIGNVAIPPEILLKTKSQGQLSDNEKQMLERVPEIGGQLLSNIPRLENVSKIVLYRDKRFDGSGFPKDNVAGKQIPEASRILKIVFDMIQLEMTNLSSTNALNQLATRLGWYDPEILQVAATLFVSDDDQKQAAVKTSTKATLKEIRVGHTLLSDVETSGGILIVSAGHVITPALLVRLHNFASLNGIKEPIYVEASAKV